MTLAHKSWQESKREILDERVCQLQEMNSAHTMSDDEEALAIQDGAADESDSEMEFSAFGALPSSKRIAQTLPAAAAAKRPRVEKTESVPPVPPVTVTPVARPKKGERPEKVRQPEKSDKDKEKLAASKRAASNDAARAKAQEAFARSQEQFSDDKMWNNKLRLRQVEAMSKNLSQLATPLSDEKLGADLMTFAENAEATFKFFQTIRANPAPLRGLQKESQAICERLSPAVLSNILVFVASHILKEIEPDKDSLADRTMDYFTLMSMSPPAEPAEPDEPDEPDDPKEPEVFLTMNLFC